MKKLFRLNKIIFHNFSWLSFDEKKKINKIKQRTQAQSTYSVKYCKFRSEAYNFTKQ